MNVNSVDTRGARRPRVSLRWFSPAYTTKTGFEVPSGTAKEAVSTESTPPLPPPRRSGVQEGKEKEGSRECRRGDLEGRGEWGIWFLYGC